MGLLVQSGIFPMDCTAPGSCICGNSCFPPITRDPLASPEHSLPSNNSGKMLAHGKLLPQPSPPPDTHPGTGRCPPCIFSLYSLYIIDIFHFRPVKIVVPNKNCKKKLKKIPYNISESLQLILLKTAQFCAELSSELTFFVTSEQRAQG